MADLAVERSIPPKMSTLQKAMFGIGAAAFGIKDGGFGVFLAIFYNQIVGLPPAWTGVAVFVAVFTDAVIDPLIGAVSDRWRSPNGRRHPFMLASALPVAVLYFFLWNPPSWTPIALFYYLMAISVFVRIAIACVEIPSGALVPELSRDYDERTSILSWRLFFQLVIPATVYVITLNTFMKSTPDYSNGVLNPHAYFGYSTFASVVMFASILIATIGTRSRIPYLKTNLDVPTVPIIVVVREAFQSLSNPSFILVTISGIFSAMATGVATVLNTYFGIFFWKFSSGQLAVLGLSAVVASFIAAPISPWVSRRFGKKRAGITLAIVWLIVAHAAQIAKLLNLLPPDGSNALLAIVFGTTLFGWTLILMSLILILSMISDVNEDNEVRTGRRSEGVFAAAGSFINKVVTGLGLLIGNLLLAAVAFPKGAKPETVDPGIVRELVLINIPIQILLIGIAIGLLALYRIDRAKHEDNLRKLSDAVAVEAQIANLVDTPKLG